MIHLNIFNPVNIYVVTNTIDTIQAKKPVELEEKHLCSTEGLEWLHMNVECQITISYFLI